MPLFLTVLLTRSHTTLHSEANQMSPVSFCRLSQECPTADLKLRDLRIGSRGGYVYHFFYQPFPLRSLTCFNNPQLIMLIVFQHRTLYSSNFVCQMTKLAIERQIIGFTNYVYTSAGDFSLMDKLTVNVYVKV